MTPRTEREIMLAGEMYLASDPELVAGRLRARRITRIYNQITEEEPARRLEILRDLIGAMGDSAEIEPNFRVDYGANISLGDRFYANFDCIILDCNRVTIGREVKFGPRVQVLTAYHPTDPVARASGRELAAPITIGDGVWVGAGAIIGPGVTIGEGSTIGAGAVVTRDVPPRSIAVGVPCRVVRTLDPDEPPP